MDTYIALDPMAIIANLTSLIVLAGAAFLIVKKVYTTKHKKS